MPIKNGDPIIAWNLWKPSDIDGGRREFKCKVVTSMTDRALDIFRLQDLEEGKAIEPIVSMELPRVLLTPSGVVIRGRITGDTYILTLGEVPAPKAKPASIAAPPARSSGFVGLPCQTCGNMDTIHAGTCLLCTRCGSTSGCS